MIGRLAALVLLSTVCQTKDMPQPFSLTVVEPGDNATLSCLVAKAEAGLFNWYRLKSGYMVQTIAAGSFDKISLEDQFNNPRFEIKKEGTLFLLVIRNVSKEDEATYFCQAGAPYTMKVVNGTFLTVNDHKNRHRLVYVKQRPETQPVRAGDKVSLQCSLLFKYKETRVQCPHEHDVYWFRAGSGESPPGVIYTKNPKSDEEEERGCVYSLSKTILNSSDAGTYYCAVVTCGEILFGEGTTVTTKLFPGQEWSPVVIILGALLALCLIVIAVLIFSRD